MKILPLALILLSGCGHLGRQSSGDYDMRQAERKRQHLLLVGKASWEVKNAVRDRRLLQGMTPNEVKAAWSLYGFNKPRVTKVGSTEQWTVRDVRKTPRPVRGRLYFKRGKLNHWRRK